MACYKVLAQSWISGQLYEAGEIVNWTGTPGPNLQVSDQATYLAQGIGTKRTEWVQPANPPARTVYTG